MPNNMNRMAQTPAEIAAAELTRQKRRLANQVKPPAAGSRGSNQRPAVKRREGTISNIGTAVYGTSTFPSVEVTWSVGGEPSAGCRYVESYSPRIGDLVYVDFVGSDPVVIGKLAVPEQGWQKLAGAMVNSWAALGGNSPPMWRVLAGRVELTGAIQGGSLSFTVPAFAIPSQWAPVGDRQMACLANNAAAGMFVEGIGSTNPGYCCPCLGSTTNFRLDGLGWTYGG